MSKAQDKKRNQVKQARLEIVAGLYKRGYSLRKIQSEVLTRLDLPTYSLATVHKDVETLLTEWRENRLDDMDAALTLELERIDETVRELWEQWEKSKTDYVRTNRSRKGAPAKDKDKGDKNSDGERIKTFSVEESSTNIVGLGNPSYISEIRQQLAERRKLLGLYAPEKKDISGDVSFASFLVESGMLDDAEEQSETE